MGRTVIELENVTKYYDSHIGRSGGLKNLLLNFAKSEAECKRYTVLENLSFKIEEGTSTAIVGRNGVGKSTLLSIIAGVLLPSSGKVRVSGKVSSLLELGAGFHPDLTGRENVRLYGMLLGFSKKMILERVEAIKE
ncbi:MAG: sugar ABC transporter ATP-binding protein, partial [Bdellovibrionaceae bacterium]|nr:sugar ABC transporter ATP-binding protein [Pseudobdellovibrionaceae bacterium]